MLRWVFSASSCKCHINILPYTLQLVGRSPVGMDISGRFNAEGFYADLRQRMQSQGSSLTAVHDRAKLVCEQRSRLAGYVPPSGGCPTTPASASDRVHRPQVVRCRGDQKIV